MGESKILGQQIRIGMRQAFQHNDRGRCSEVNDSLTSRVPAAACKSSTGAIQPRTVLGPVQPPQVGHLENEAELDLA